MNCEVFTLAELVESGSTAIFVRNRLTKPDSDFQRKLTDLLFGKSKATEADGHIALVFDYGEIVGWARTESWGDWDTLEAFVAPDYRLRGIASFAAAGLYAIRLFDTGCTVAVFAPSMMLVAKRAGMSPVLHTKIDGEWVQQ